MEQGGTRVIESIGPLFKIVRQRQQLYFQLLYFVTKHIESSSNDLDNTIFQGFIRTQHHKNNTQQQQQRELINLTKQEQQQQVNLNDRTSKQLHRLSSRILEILDNSTTKVRKTIFDDRGRVTAQFARFKLQLQRIIRHQPFRVGDYMEHVISFCSRKYQRQVSKVQRYIDRVTQGDDISLKELFCKDNSDVEHSSPEEPPPPSVLSPKKRPVIKIVEVKQQNSEEESSPEKKPHSLKKPRSIKKRSSKKEEIEQSGKARTAGKLLSFYSSLKLNKPEFLEDYVYNQLQAEKHRAELMSRLEQRNKANKGQIALFFKKRVDAKITDLNKKGESQRHSTQERSETPAALNKKLSSHKGFIIKRKSSAHFDSSSGNQKNSDTEKLLNTTIHNVRPPGRRSSQISHRNSVDKSQPKYVVQQPKVFDDEAIPQVPLTFRATAQRFNPRTSRPKEKKNQNLRLKRLNNPAPVENNFLQETFCYQS